MSDSPSIPATLPPSVRISSAVSESRYIGKPCAKHPELGGLRLIRNYVCVECMRETRRRSRKITPIGDPTKRRGHKIQKVAELIAHQLGQSGDWTPHVELAADIVDYVLRGVLPTE